MTLFALLSKNPTIVEIRWAISYIGELMTNLIEEAQNV